MDGTATEIVVRAGEVLGPTNPGLRGLVWNTGPIDGVIPIEPTGIRIRSTAATRSKDSHLGIVIPWSGPASGRQPAAARPLYLGPASPRIVAGRPGC